MVRSQRMGLGRAFTLVELLVVVAIIALLLGILLPALGKARQIAEGAACMAHLRGTATGMATYATEWNGFLAGPNTSGAHLNSNQVSAIGQHRNAPVQNMDWVSPTLGDALGLPDDPIDRVLAIFNTRLKCPSNKLKYTSIHNAGGLNITANAAEVNYSSYSANELLHVYRTDPGNGGIFIRNWIDSVVRIPDRPTFKSDRMGSPSGKVYAMDGARYVDNAGPITFNGAVKQIDGGNYMSWTPALAATVNNGNPYKRDAQGNLTANAQRAAYRHLDRLNAVFLDGHVESLDNDASRNVALYFPAGSVVQNAGGTDDANDSNGDVIP